MPRIDAPTVAEHRAARERALLDAARTLLAADPDRVPTLADVGELAGLSRSSVYQYFTSRDDLLAAVVRDSFPRWQQKLDEAVAAADGPRAQVLAFLRVNLDLVADGDHAVARAMSVITPSEEVQRRAAEFHDRLLVPVEQALTELGAPDLATTVELVGALVLAAAREVERTGDVERAYRATAALLDPYLRDLEDDTGATT